MFDNAIVLQHIVTQTNEDLLLGTIMADRKFIMDLAKLLVAAAWADRELKGAEINALKDLLFSLKDITGREWAELEIYMDSPVTPEETDNLLRQVVDQIKTTQDKDLVVGTLEKLFEADGVVTEEERALLDQITSAVADVGTTVFSKLSKMLKAAVVRRSENYEAGVQRDAQIDDYIENTIYYQLKSQFKSKGIDIDVPEQKLRKLCLAAGLLARIAVVDKEISDKEKQAITKILSAQWNLPEPEADLITQISCSRTLKGLDNFRLSRVFFECTDLAERKAFLACLFAIANASEKTSYDETEEIRTIANSLKLSHKDFINAKLTIPDEQREVL